MLLTLVCSSKLEIVFGKYSYIKQKSDKPLSKFIRLFVITDPEEKQDELPSSIRNDRVRLVFEPFNLMR